MEKQKSTAFGLLFEKAVHGEEEAVPLVYDETVGITFTTTPSGHRVPYVSTSLQETVTITEVAREQTDSDAPSTRSPTVTVTAVEKESTDSD